MTPTILTVNFMSHFAWITCLWPGLSRLWLRGQWMGLGWAAGFGVWLNLVLTCQFVWAPSLPPYGIEILWLCTSLILATGMIDGIYTTRGHLRQDTKRRMHDRDYTDRSPAQTDSNSDSPGNPDLSQQAEPSRLDVVTREHEDAPPTRPTDALFIRARNQYLKGNWYEAESLIQQIMSEFPNDLEARLLFISLRRHQGRLEEALIAITEMQKWDDSEKWDFEIADELNRLERILSDSDAAHDTPQAA